MAHPIPLEASQVVLSRSTQPKQDQVSPAGLGGGPVLAVCCAMRDDLVLDTVWVFEEERVVTWRRVLGILPGRSDDKSANSLDLLVKAVNLRARFRSKREVMKRPRSSPMDRLALKSLSRRRDGKREKRVAVLHHEKVVLFDHRTHSIFLVEAKERKKQIVERYGHRHIANRYLDVINDGLHAYRFPFETIWVFDAA